MRNCYMVPVQVLSLSLVMLCAVGLWAQAPPTNTIVVVGQHQCPGCQDALPTLGWLHPKWQEKGLKVLYYSLDAAPQDYTAYPVAVTRLQERWEHPIIKKLGTYATPTYYWFNAVGDQVAETETAMQMHLEIVRRSNTNAATPM